MQSLALLRPSQPVDCLATVLASIQLTPTIKSIRLRLESLEGREFSFLPGQSVWPKFEREGKQFSKIYSIASSPAACPEVELCVSRVGWSSAYLQDLPVGGAIALRGPYGLMTLTELPQRPRLYIAEGSGIAPLKSQMAWLRECRFPYPVYLVLANPETPDCLPYDEEWRSLQQSWSNFYYIEAANSQPERVLAQQGLNLAQFEIDICAVNDRVSQIYEAVLSMGANPSQTRFEKFFAF